MIAVLVPEMLAVTVSIAVTVWLPAVLKVTVKVPTPLVSVASLGTRSLGVAAGEVDSPGVSGIAVLLS